VTEDDVARIRRHQERLAARRAEELAHASEPAVTSDGHRVEVVANIGGLEDAQEATGKGAEGVGLLRWEFVFLDRTKAPTEDEQAEVYTAIAKALTPGQPLVIRTLDVGGDKPLPYLPIAPEENPSWASGVSGSGWTGPRCCAPRSGRSSGPPTPAPGSM
jgi:multiphosphoryl transfer protein